MDTPEKPYMETWRRLATPPQDALKKITGGRLAGMTDIKPQWRIKAMTEAFGQCGEGWKWELKRTWIEIGSDNQIVACVEISLYVRTWREDHPSVDGIAPMSYQWSDPIPGIGGSMLVANERSGPYTNDEAFKMATTDALGVAMKFLGVASDVYEGKMGDSSDRGKYEPKPDSWKPPSASQADAKAATPDDGGFVKGIITHFDTQSGEGKKGRWTVYKITINDKKMATFDKKIGEFARTAHTNKAEMLATVEKNDKGYLNVVELRIPQPNKTAIFPPPDFADNGFPF